MEFVGKMCKTVLFHDNMEENKVKSYWCFSSNVGRLASSSAMLPQNINGI
jgi:hypothetical protein